MLCFGITKADIANVNRKANKYSHWSIMVSGGFNMLICERTTEWMEHEWAGHDNYGNGLMGNYKDNFAPAGLFQADYMVTPQFGVRLQYLYAPINKNAIYTGDSKIFSDINGQSHQATIQLTVNLLNIFYRCRNNVQWGWYAGTGIGSLCYKIPTFDKYRPVVCIPVSTSVEFSPIKSMSIVFHAEFDWYGDDEVNGIDCDDQLNDMGLYVGLGLRYNINAVKKSHTRLTDMCSFEPLHVGSGSSGKSKFKEKETTEKDIEELQDKMNELEKRNRDLSDRIELMNREIMERLDEYMIDSLDAGNIDSKNKTQKEPTNTNTNKISEKKNEQKINSNSNNNNSKNTNTNNSSTTPSQSQITTVDKKKTEYTKPSESNLTSVEGPSDIEKSNYDNNQDLKQEKIFNEAMMSNGTEANEVIFDLQSSRVKSKYEVKIAAVAKRMLANKKLQLDIFSYLTKEQLTKANVELATKRMEAIYYILVNRYMIDQNRIRYDIVEPAEEVGSSDIRCDMVYR